MPGGVYRNLAINFRTGAVLKKRVRHRLGYGPRRLMLTLGLGEYKSYKHAYSGYCHEMNGINNTYALDMVQA